MREREEEEKEEGQKCGREREGERGSPWGMSTGVENNFLLFFCFFNVNILLI